MSKKTAHEATHAKARLAATHVVAVADRRSAATKGKDYLEASRRLTEMLNEADIREWQRRGLDKKHITVAEMLIEECASVLQDAPLTINIEPYKFFGAKVKGDRFQSIWNRLRAKEPGYADPRDKAEKLMFGYDDGDEQIVDGVNVGRDISRYGGTQGLGADGRPRSHSFVADMRPKYAAVNFTWAKFGAASTYGMSHFVLKHHLRFNAVFCPRDSFGLEARSQLGTYFNLYPVLNHCAEYVLKQIVQSARSRRGRGGAPPADPPLFPIFHHEKVKGADGSKGSDYIEAILHTEVVFKRDVHELRIARQELTDKQHGDPVSGKIWTVRGSTIQKNVNAFLKQHNLRDKVVYI